MMMSFSVWLIYHSQMPACKWTTKCPVKKRAIVLVHTINSVNSTPCFLYTDIYLYIIYMHCLSARGCQLYCGMVELAIYASPCIEVNLRTYVQYCSSGFWSHSKSLIIVDLWFHAWSCIYITGYHLLSCSQFLWIIHNCWMCKLRMMLSMVAIFATDKHQHLEPGCLIVETTKLNATWGTEVDTRQPLASTVTSQVLSFTVVDKLTWLVAMTWTQSNYMHAYAQW